MVVNSISTFESFLKVLPLQFMNEEFTLDFPTQNNSCWWALIRKIGKIQFCDCSLQKSLGFYFLHSRKFKYAETFMYDRTYFQRKKKNCLPLLWLHGDEFKKRRGLEARQGPLAFKGLQRLSYPLIPPQISIGFSLLH